MLHEKEYNMTELERKIVEKICGDDEARRIAEKFVNSQRLSDQQVPSASPGTSHE